MTAEPHGRDGRLRVELRARRDAGASCSSPTSPAGWTRLARGRRAVAAAGADAIEIGIPFSDPVMDGPVIQEASERALAGRRRRPGRVLDELPRPRRRRPARGDDVLQPGLPRRPRRFARALRRRRGGRRPSCPTYRSRSRAVGRGRRRRRRRDGACWPRRPRPTSGCRGSAPGRGASSTPSACWASPGSGTSLAATATDIAGRLKAVTDRPVLVGVGVSNAAQAREASRVVADGVIRGLGRPPAARRRAGGRGRVRGGGSGGARRDYSRDFVLNPHPGPGGDRNNGERAGPPPPPRVLSGNDAMKETTMTSRARLALVLPVAALVLPPPAAATTTPAPTPPSPQPRPRPPRPRR